MARLSEIKINAPAKINLGLEVIGRREDGYHNIETLFQAIDLYDELHIAPADSGVFLSVDRTDLDVRGENLIHKAATVLLEYASCRKGIKVHLNKRIPIGAGLGGGSSDAAAMLKGLIQIYDLSVSQKEINRIASSLGADVPFFLNGPTAFGYGTGDILEPSPPLPSFWVVLVKPDFSISTGWVYREYDLRLTKRVNKFKILKYAINSANPQKIGRAMFNDFESVCFAKFPILSEIKAGLLSLGACGALMSGSGSCIFGLFSDEKSAREACRSLEMYGGSSEEVLLCHTILK